MDTPRAVWRGGRLCLGDRPGDADHDLCGLRRWPIREHGWRDELDGHQPRPDQSRRWYGGDRPGDAEQALRGHGWWRIREHGRGSELDPDRHGVPGYRLGD